MCWMEVLDRMDIGELERIWDEVWKEDGARGGCSTNEQSGRNGVRKRKRVSWRLIKEPINPRGLVRFENNIFRVVQRYGRLYLVPKFREVRISEKGRRVVHEAYEIPVMAYEEFFDKYLSHMQTWSTVDINGTKVSRVQQKFLRSIMEENILPMTGDITVRRC